MPTRAHNYSHGGICLYCGQGRNALNRTVWCNVESQQNAQPEDVLRFCRDCRHAERGAWICRRPNLGPVSLVTGEIPNRTPLDCSWERDEPHPRDLSVYGFERCGPEAKFFEPREQ